MDLDNCGAMLRLVAGLETDPEALARESYHEAGPGTNFLSTGHTLRHFAAANYQPAIAEPGPYETWLGNGSRTAEQRASDRWKAMLASYEAPPIDAGLDEALSAFVARRKAEMPDEWY
jgi:trimethylamine--corrinoid protein Co-methyltransferase